MALSQAEQDAEQARIDALVDNLPNEQSSENDWERLQLAKEQGALDANIMLGYSKSELGDLSYGNTETLRTRANQGLTSSEARDFRSLGMGASRSTGAALGRQGVRGPASASAYRQLGRDQAQGMATISSQYRRDAEGELRKDTSRKQLATAALESGQTQLVTAGMAAEAALAAANKPIPQDDSSMSVVCTELHRQGYLTGAVYEGDCLAQEHIMNTTPWVYEGYYFWAKHVASWMKTSAVITFICKPIALSWAQHMAFKFGKTPQGSKFGLIINAIGWPLCWLIGKGLRAWDTMRFTIAT